MEKYTYEFEGEQKTGVYTVIPDRISTGNNVIMRVDSTIDMDTSANISNYIKLPSDLYNYYGFISYRALGETNEIKIKSKDVIYEKNKYTYFEVPASIKNADKIELILLVRGQKYTLILK